MLKLKSHWWEVFYCLRDVKIEVMRFSLPEAGPRGGGGGSQECVTMSSYFEAIPLSLSHCEIYRHEEKKEVDNKSEKWEKVCM